MFTTNSVYVILALAVAFLIAFASTPAVIALAHKIRAIDIPKDERRVHKKPIPRFPSKIGIITADTGAAVADMKNILT